MGNTMQKKLGTIEIEKHNGPLSTVGNYNQGSMIDFDPWGSNYKIVYDQNKYWLELKKLGGVIQEWQSNPSKNLNGNAGLMSAIIESNYTGSIYCLDQKGLLPVLLIKPNSIMMNNKIAYHFEHSMLIAITVADVLLWFEPSEYTVESIMTRLASGNGFPAINTTLPTKQWVNNYRMNYCAIPRP